MKLPPLGYFLIPVLGETLLLRFLSRIFYPVKINNFYKPPERSPPGGFSLSSRICVKTGNLPCKTGPLLRKIIELIKSPFEKEGCLKTFSNS